MPTIGAHVSEDVAKAVETAAKASPEEKVGPYVAEAVRQRLDRDGFLPGSGSEEVAQITARVAAAVRKDRSLVPQIDSLLGKSTVRRVVSA